MLITVKVDLRQVNSMLSRQSLALRDQRAMWRAALVVFYSHTSEVFEKQGYPDKWPPLKASTIRRRRHGSPSVHGGIKGGSVRILRDTGHLMKSVTGPSSFGFAKITAHSLAVGSNLPYSGYHMSGTQHMPARVFLTALNEVLDRMAAAMTRTLDRLSHP